MTSVVDPITLEVVREGLIAIVCEMRATVIRASYSPVIRDMDDFSCALFDAQGRMVAQSEDHPGHVLPMPWSVRCALEDFRGRSSAGDVILLNDSYRGGVTPKLGDEPSGSLPSIPRVAPSTRGLRSPG